MYYTFVRADFNPRSLAGATLVKRAYSTVFSDFNPRSLAGATEDTRKMFYMQKFQSTLPCGSDIVDGEDAEAVYISIHAPLRERHHAQLFQTIS